MGLFEGCNYGIITYIIAVHDARLHAVQSLLQLAGLPVTPFCDLPNIVLAKTPMMEAPSNFYFWPEDALRERDITTITLDN